MTQFRALLLSSLCVAGIATACSSDPAPSDASTPTDVTADTTADVASDTTPPADAQPDVTQDAAADVTADVPATDVPATDVPATDVPATDVPAVDVPSADVPATDVPATDVPAVDVTPADVPATDVPSADASVDAARDVAVDVTPDAAVDVAPTDSGVETIFEATLSGAQEVPSVTSTATGTATITLNAARTGISYVVRHTVTGATAGHIHIGAAGTNGGVAVAFASTGAEITGTATLTPAQVANLEAGEMYVNLHTTANPGGEIRGQVLRRGEELYVAPLSGYQEVPALTSTSSGTASVIYNPATSTIHYRVTTTATPTAAHIHRAIAGVNGAVAYALTPTGATIDNFQAVTPVDVDSLRNGRFYVNVHTTANPGGELRGQLLTPGTQLFVANLVGGQEVPAVTTTSTGNAMVLLNYARDTVRVVLSSTATATAAHLHRAHGGANGPVAIGLTAAGTEFTASSAITAADATLLELGGLYANVHTAANPGGEVRGQVLRPGEQLYTAILSGANEVPPVTTAASGVVAFVISAPGTLATYTGTLSGLTPTAAHIHMAPAGMNGAVSYTLSTTPTGFNGTVAIAAGSLTIADMGGYYVNVHTAANPGGEIRGQITRR